MNPTKNVRYIEVEKDIFEKLYDCKLDEKVLQIQAKFQQLENEVSEKMTRWMKLKDTEYYFDFKTKILFPETRNMHITYLGMHVSDSFSERLLFLDGCSEATLNQHRENADNVGMILPDNCKKYILGNEAHLMWHSLAKEIFDDKSCPCLNSNGALETIDGKSTTWIIINHPSQSIYNIATGHNTGCKSVDGALSILVYKFAATSSSFDLMIEHGFYPEQFEESINKALQECHNVVSKNVDFRDFYTLKSFLKNSKITELLGVDLRKEAIENEIEAEEVDLNASDGIGYILKDYFDTCDYIRARIQKYNSKWYLSDEGRGHWELWGEPEQQKNVKVGENEKETDAGVNVSARKRVLALKNGVIARNPIADVKHDAVVGIDFGTKSTIVALQDGDDQIIPLRVGMADYSIAPKVEHFENPTVMQFVDLGKFVTQYNKSAGRPMTSWDDLLISHEAFEHLIDAEKSIDIASFTTDIKQWASGKYRNKDHGHLIIKDSKGYRYDIDNYMELTDEDIDLIEIYAYYIGLFINNMHTGIHLDYILSFPETFSKEIKERILNSFTKGIRKSIPAVVLEDEECVSEFRVRQGPSEPAAYAACALEQYGIEPTDNGVFYGIFDFGGGTTDYDYGIWKNAPEDEFTYNYVIKHYGSGGDKTLGGENILQLLAYNVFSDDAKNSNGESNLDIMRKNKLVYYRPDEGKVIPGTEALNNSSESAMLNTKLMMEALRPIWEEWEDVQEWFSQDKKKNKLELAVGAKNVSVLFDSDSSVKAKLSLFSDQDREEVTLNIDMAMVNQVINDRIESGVRNFFEGLVQAYEKIEKKNETKIHIFLAGNSSKSRRVMRFFEDYVIGYNGLMFGEDISEKEMDEDKDVEVKEKSIFDSIFKNAANYNINDATEKEDEITHLNSIEKSHFIVYPPLGTEIARKIQQNRGIEIEENNLMAPTGKTGVAFGLVMCREGSMIKVESETKKSEQIKLNFYIGINYRKNFKLIFDRNVGYGKWMKFSRIAADTETFEFYYSELPEVVGNDITIKDNKSIYKHKCLVDGVNKDAFIYFKFISPTQLEYVVAAEDKVELGEYISKIYKVNL